MNRAEQTGRVEYKRLEFGLKIKKPAGASFELDWRNNGIRMIIRDYVARERYEMSLF